MLPPSGLARMNECPMTKGVLWKLPGLELPCKKASLVAQLVKNLPAMQETPVQFLGWYLGLGSLLVSVNSAYVGFHGDLGDHTCLNARDSQTYMLALLPLCSRVNGPTGISGISTWMFDRHSCPERGPNAHSDFPHQTSAPSPALALVNCCSSPTLFIAQTRT